MLLPFKLATIYFASSNIEQATEGMKIPRLGMRNVSSHLKYTIHHHSPNQSMRSLVLVLNIIIFTYTVIMVIQSMFYTIQADNKTSLTPVGIVKLHQE